jgi:hypothetical protein
MADNFKVPFSTEVAAPTIGTDERLIAGNLVHVQRVSDQGASGFTTSQVTVGTTATLLANGRDTRKSIWIKVDPSATVPVFVGGSTVTTATGFHVAVGSTQQFGTTVALYGVVSSGTAKVYVAEEYDA